MVNDLLFGDVTLNIGLASSSIVGGRLSVAHKLRTITKALPELFMPGYIGHMYLTPHRVWVGEPMLVVQGTLRPIAASSTLLFDLTKQIEQDCIAVYNHDQDVGTLIGPRVEAWGVFNVNFFTFIGDKDD